MLSTRTHLTCHAAAMHTAVQVDGLFNPSTALSYDFATVIYRWQLLGYNSIRLPFSMQNLYSASPPQNKLSTTCSLPSFVSRVACHLHISIECQHLWCHVDLRAETLPCCHFP